MSLVGRSCLKHPAMASVARGFASGVVAAQDGGSGGDGSMRRPILALALWAALLGAPAQAGDEGGPVFAAPTTADSIGRVFAPVFVNGQGPFRFVVDTGANRSVLAPHLAARLGVDVANAQRQLVHGVTGAEPAPIVRVGELRVGRLARRDLDLPVLSNRLHAGADGTLGADQLRGGRLVIDFERDRIELFTSSAPPPARYLILPAQMRFGQLPMVSAKLGHVTVKAVIDTGAERSIGNGALQRALVRERARLEREGMTTVYGAVGPDLQAELVWAPRLVLGGVRIERLPILFADTHFFQIWRLEDEPALLIGMDVLGQVDALVIDYRRREVSLRLPGGNPGIDRRAKASRL
jgi:predicted aspartyl protease